MLKKIAFFFLITLPHFLGAQIVKILPGTAGAGDQIELIYDASKGTAGLIGASSVYIHTGVVTDSPTGTAWQYVKGNWGQDDGIGKMSKIKGENNLWSITLSPNIREYYEVPAGVPIFRLSMVFRNADGTKEGKGTPGNFAGGFVASNNDIYIDLNVNNFVQITKPLKEDLFLKAGVAETFQVKASGVADKLSLSLDTGNGYEEVRTLQNAQILSYDYTASSSAKVGLKAEAIFGTDTQSVVKELKVNLLPALQNTELPAGLKKGINYHSDPTKVTLVLEAPKKDFVYVVGDFSNWEVEDKFLMNKTPDGELFWLELSNLEKAKNYVFQYWVEGSIKVGDPYADQVADPWNDQYIASSVFGDLPSYNRQDYGIASVFKTGQEPFNWSSTEDTWKRPAKEELIIYELLVRDFIGSHDFKDLSDTLSYLKRLGVNAIELMPIMEFEGNESWGYNPSYFFAPDKYYGTKNDLKSFIQKAHQEGFAVILDMVLNHAFGQNALVKMYWDEGNNRPAANSPWFNTTATHPFNVGYDFNHESSYTQAFVDSVNAYWLTEYHFDGFRFDLSKGFTQNRNTDVGRWSARDNSRIALLKRMAGKVQAIDEHAYIILEHFADESEENELQAAGMLTWGNNNHDFAGLMLGNTSNTLSTVSDKGKVAYMESHDEQRQIFYAENGAVALKSTYDPRKEIVALNRLKMMTAFFYTQPGAKMMWQFQELGYDVDIDFNGRVGNKPLVWGDGSLKYYEDEERQKLYKTHAAIIDLVSENKEAFRNGNFSSSLQGNIKSISIEHEDLDVVIIGNFDIEESSTSFSFPKEGWWFNYFQKDSINVSGAVEFNLKPGEFHVLTSEKQKDIEDSLITFFEARDTLIVRGEVVTVSPVSFQPDTEITITFNAEEGTAGLIGANKVYMHSGIITSSESGTEWQYVKGNWGADDGIGQMTKMNGSENKWQITLKPKDYYSQVPANAKWYRIGMVFRNADGTAEGKDLGGTDIFVNFTEGQEQVLAEEKKNVISVYPNPGHSFLKVESEEEIIECELMDMNGRRVLKVQNCKVLDLRGLHSGQYLLKLKTGSGFWTKRVVIN